jgi:hypothetical protein
MDTINRLQFRHHNEIFDDRCKAIEYIYDSIKENGAGLASEQNSPYGYSLFAEPTILRYKNEDDEVHECKGNETCEFKKGPHIMLVIGSETNDTIYHNRNKFCIIDIDKTEEEIKDLEEELAKAIKSLTLAVFDSSTLDLHVEKTEDGTFLSGDVKTAETHVFEGMVKENNLMVVPFEDAAGPEGLFIYVDLTYDDASETFTFVVSQADGTLKRTAVKLPNNYLVSGEYKKSDESLHLHMKNGDEVVIDCEELIAEWNVEGDASKTPIVLTREEVDYDGTDEHHHVEPWQDVLRADVRLADDRPANILKKTTDGRYLYVDGVASNIVYYWNGDRSNVKEQLDKLNKIKISQDNDNIIWERADGYFASTSLDYISSENKLILTTSSVSGAPIKHEVRLNTVDVIESIVYDPTREELIIKYKNDKGETKTVRVPISGMIDEWEVLNTAHSVKLVKQRKTSGKDILTADVNISSLEDNIIEEKSEQGLHTLYVKGTASNIKYGNGTVKDALDDLIEEDENLNKRIDDEILRATTAEEALDGKIDQEIADRTADVERIDITIGSGFTTDAHETVTYKFEQLTDKLDNEIERATSEEERIEGKLDNEIERSMSADTVHDGRLDTIDEEIGDGFGPRFTIKDAVDALSADTRASLKHVINEDKSIDVVEREGAEGKEAVIKVNLSSAETQNTLRLEGDGLYNFIDLAYNPDTNVLTLTRSDNASTENVTKELQLNSVSIIDGMEYDPTTETLIIKYHSGSEQKELRIPLGEIFQEWEVYNDPDSAVKLNRERVIDGKDKLSGEVVITSTHTDNILANDHGALYVPANTDVTAALSGAIDQEIADRINDVNTEKARAISAETALNNKIESETVRAISAETALSGAINTVQTNLENEIDRATASETRIETKLDNEITRATAEDQRLYQLIVDEQIRATNADEVLDGKINDEIVARVQGDADLKVLISGETSAREAKDNILETKIDTEIERSKAADSALTAALDDEEAAREAGDAELMEEIRKAKLTFSPANDNFESNGTIEFNRYDNDNNVVKANVIIPNDDNIIIVDNGIKASVKLEYNAATNTLLLEKTSASGRTFDTVQLNAGSIIESITYDNETKELVIRYESTSEPGIEKETRVGVSDLFNPWVVNNPSEKSAVELTKTFRTGPLAEDELSGRVLITDDHDGDGKPDQGSDNIIEIRNNGLYVCGSGITESKEILDCIQNEAKAFETAVIGHVIGQKCGSGYTYEPHNMAKYIISATSFNNADFILDQNLKRVEIFADDISAKTDCVDDKTDKIYQLLYGEGQSMQGCGESTSYQPYLGACVISGATSFMEADQMLNDQICQILTMWVSGITCSNESTWVEDGMNRKLQVDARLSHGNNAEMDDDNLYIHNLDGDYIDPTGTEFTDTNVLRMVCLTESPGGVIPDIKSKQNGIYLSNVWDCGLYYGPEDADAKAAAEEAGYNTDYSTDEDAGSTNYNYMNNVRQHDI